ncbi:hypothetical protein DFH09DRAFT_1102844 [Mycena vulgaris]|nr:hypothetical protein DFH09DRAFT_1102844 [Mycena vulgaris]
MLGLEDITDSDDSHDDSESNMAAVSEEASGPSHAPVVSRADNGDEMCEVSFISFKSVCLQRIIPWYMPLRSFQNNQIESQWVLLGPALIEEAKSEVHPVEKIEK